VLSHFRLTTGLLLGKSYVHLCFDRHLNLSARFGPTFLPSLVVQDNAEEGRIYVEPAVVLDEAKFSEFIHEKIHS